MTVREAKRHIENITKKYFTGAVVGFSGQSANVKSKSPYVCITPGSPTRDQFPVQRMVNDRMVSYYQTKLPLQIDLYTNGAEGSPGPDGFVTMEDTAVDDMTDFVDYLESPYVIHWCDRINATIVVNGPVQQLTGLVTDTDYQFRAMVELVFCYVHKAVGYTGIQGESSIVYPGEPDTPGEPGTPVEPGTPGAAGNTGDGSEPGYITPDDAEDGVEIKPVYEPTSSGGRSKALVEETETGYFTEVEIKYQKEESDQ